MGGFEHILLSLGELGAIEVQYSWWICGRLATVSMCILALLAGAGVGCLVKVTLDELGVLGSG